MASIIGNFAKAKRLVGRPHSSLYLMTQVLHVPLPCEYLADIDGAMMLLLNEELEIFSPEMQGVPVAFNRKSSRLMERSGSMVSAQAFTHCNLRSEFVVFKPKVGDILNGIVNKVMPSSLGCLIHNSFYATIHRKNSENMSNAKVGSKIFLRVTKLEEDGNGVLSITGEICDKQPRPKKTTSKHPVIQEVAPGIVNDSGIENSDFALSTTSAQDVDELMLNTTVENLRKPRDDVLLSDFSLSLEKPEESGCNIYCDAKSIENANERTCYSVDINAENQVSSAERTVTAALQDISSCFEGNKEKKKMKKGKKHKKKMKKDKKAKKVNKMKNSKSEEKHFSTINTSPVEKVVNAQGGPKKESSALATVSQARDIIATLSTDEFFSPSSKKKAKKVIDSNTTVNRNGDGGKTEKKSAPKRKQDADEWFSSPPAKRVAVENPSTFLTESVVQESTVSNSTVKEMSEHEQQALFHLQKLGINLPLSLLKSGKFSSPVIAEDSSTSNAKQTTVPDFINRTELPKKKSKKKSAKTTLPLNSSSEPNDSVLSMQNTPDIGYSMKNEPIHFENVTSFLKMKDNESSVSNGQHFSNGVGAAPCREPIKHKKEKKKKKKKHKKHD